VASPAGTGVLAASLGFGGKFSSDDVVGSVMLIGLAVALSLLAAAGSVTLFRRVTGRKVRDTGTR
jgi:hypothetical protein